MDGMPPSPAAPASSVWATGTPTSMPASITSVHHLIFPEEFINAYRFHPMLPNFFEYRELSSDANVIRSKIALSEILRGKATLAMRQHGPANWALSLERQRLGKLTLQNHPSFLQNLSMAV
jgi:hypothetical protein